MIVKSYNFSLIIIVKLLDTITYKKYGCWNERKRGNTLGRGKKGLFLPR